MANLYLIYASQTGRTRQIMWQIKDYFTPSHQIKMADAMHANLNEALQADLIILASYTWDEGDSYLPPEMIDLMQDLTQFDIEDRAFAVIGTGDSQYPGFAFATSEILSYLIPKGSQLIYPQLKINLTDNVNDLADFQLLLENITSFYHNK